MQVGHAQELRPLALLKELIENALDACESADVRPDLDVEITADRIRVRDNLDEWLPDQPRRVLPDVPALALAVFAHDDPEVHVHPSTSNMVNTVTPALSRREPTIPPRECRSVEAHELGRFPPASA